MSVLLSFLLLLVLLPLLGAAAAAATAATGVVATAAVCWFRVFGFSFLRIRAATARIYGVC